MWYVQDRLDVPRGLARQGFGFNCWVRVDFYSLTPIGTKATTMHRPEKEEDFRDSGPNSHPRVRARGKCTK